MVIEPVLRLNYDLERNVNAMLSENDIKNLLENGTLIEYLSEDVLNAKIKENNLQELETFHFKNKKGNDYYLNEKLNKSVNNRFKEMFVTLFLDQDMSLERIIKNKSYLVFPEENVRLKILKKEYEKTIFEIEKNVTQDEFLSFDSDLIKWKCMGIFSKHLDKILSVEGEILMVANILNFFEKDSENYNIIERNIELMLYCWDIQWLMEKLEIENGIAIQSKDEKMKEPEIEKEIDNGKPLPKKLKWTGTPAQFGFIINELIGKGYIEKPTGSYNKDAEFYFSIMDIDTTPGNLSNEVNINKNSFSANNAGKFKIPSKDKLS